MARIANPYYSGFNDPAMADIAGNIARIAAGGESPNQRALREAQLGELESRSGTNLAQGRKYASEAALNEQSHGARGYDGIIDYMSKVTGIDGQTIGALLAGESTGLDPRSQQRLRDEYRAAGGIRMAGPGTQRITDVTQSQFDARSAGDLLMGDTQGVAARRGAMGGKPTYDVKNNTIFDQYGGANEITDYGRLLALEGANSAPVEKVVDETGKPVFVSRADAIGRQPYEKPSNSDSRLSPAEVLRLDELIAMDLGVDLNSVEPDVMPRIRAQAEQNYMNGDPLSIAVERAIQDNQLEDTMPWYRGAKYAIARPAQPQQEQLASQKPVRARNPKTGEVVELRDGQWVPL